MRQERVVRLPFAAVDANGIPLSRLNLFADRGNSETVHAPDNQVISTKLPDETPQVRRE